MNNSTYDSSIIELEMQYFSENEMMLLEQIRKK